MYGIENGKNFFKKLKLYVSRAFNYFDLFECVRYAFVRLHECFTILITFKLCFENSEICTCLTNAWDILKYCENILVRKHIVDQDFFLLLRKRAVDKSLHLFSHWQFYTEIITQKKDCIRNILL